MASISTNKRRRTTADVLYISDLPIGFIADVSEYLAKPSRAILAVAFSTLSSQNDDLMHRLLDISTAIVSASRWDVLDFEAIDKELANRLTDDDVWEILTSINARDVLKRLKLCGCINIEGHGLNPLRSSVVLEQIDISLVGKHENRDNVIDSKISASIVAPILDSIASLKHVMFPKEKLWRGGAQFRQRYNLLYDSRELSCSHCNQRIITSWLSINRMLQNNVCYDCLKPFCDDCADANGEGRKTLNYCFKCDMDFCVDCVPRIECEAGCLENMCSGCAERSQCQQCEIKCCECVNTCDGCGKSRCTDCVPYRRCKGDDCNKSHCHDCYNGKEYDVKWCEEYKKMYCMGCKVDRGCAADRSLW